MEEIVAVATSTTTTKATTTITVTSTRLFQSLPSTDQIGIAAVRVEIYYSNNKLMKIIMIKNEKNNNDKE